jgi:dihydrofolate reductase
MRKVIVFNRVSLDGFYAGADGNIDWFVRDPEVDKFVRDPEVDKAGHKMIQPDTVLFGRVTYQQFESVWPAVAKDPGAPKEARSMADDLNRMTKVVFSKTLKQANWENSKLVKGDVTQEVRKIKQGNGPDILMFGSGTIVQQLASEGLIDEYLILVTPVILGMGKLMFKDVKKFNLELLKATDFKSGNVLLHYGLATV